MKEYLEHQNIELNMTMVLIARWNDVCKYVGSYYDADHEETCLVSYPQAHVIIINYAYYRETHFRPLWQQMAIVPMLYLHINVIV